MSDLSASSELVHLCSSGGQACFIVEQSGWWAAALLVGRVSLTGIVWRGAVVAGKTQGKDLLSVFKNIFSALITFY